MTILSLEWGFLFITIFNPHLVVGIYKIKLNKLFSLI